MGNPIGTIAFPHLKRAGATARGVLRAALDLALPRLCAVCREPVEGEGLCPACWAKLSFITRPYCERLGIPFVYDSGPGMLSMEAIADPPAYQRARAAVRFDDIRPRAGACAQIWRPARSRADDGPLAGQGRQRAVGRGRCARAGAAALAAALGAALQPIGFAGRSRRAGKRRADRGGRRSSG